MPRERVHKKKNHNIEQRTKKVGSKDELNILLLKIQLLFLELKSSPSRICN